MSADAAHGHVVLLGDSIFDNAAYIAGAPDVVRQLDSALPEGWRASLLAVDGAVTSDVPGQLAELPQDATHLVVSAGGNDAIGYAHLLSQRCSTVGEAVSRLADARDSFARGYEAMLEAVLERRVPATVSTIYDANYPLPEGRVIASALSLFNDVITRAAFSRGLPLLDLRLICNEPDDYANPIEPSAKGGEKMARAIAGFAIERRVETSRSVVIAG